MLCRERSSPRRRGYMARLQDEWVTTHPELAARSTQQQLRDYAAYLIRTGFIVIRPTDQRPIAHEQASECAEVPIEEIPINIEEEGQTSGRRDLKTKAPPKPEDINLANGKLADELLENCDLWTINCAVYATAKLMISPRGVTHRSDTEVRAQQRMQKLDAKLEISRRCASRIKCVVDYITSGRKFTTKVRRFARELRDYHHTLNKLKLQIIQQHIRDKIRVLALAKKQLVKRLRCIRENAMFYSDPSRLFQKPSPVVAQPPTENQVTDFWKKIYEQPAPFKEDTPAITLFTDFCRKFNLPDEECRPVTAREVEDTIKGTKNFSAPGPDGVCNFWWKKLTATHDHLARIFTKYLSQEESVPSWLVEGRTVLLPKKGDLSDPKNYRPITCLNTVYKIFTSILYSRILQTIQPIWQQIYEQRGSKKGVAGCRESLLIDRCICQDSIQYKRNLSMAWIDYRKAFDSTSHELIISMLKRLQVHPNIVRCIEVLMSLWKTRFTITAGKRKLTTTWITFQRGVYQGDCLSPLLFCISLMPLSVALRQSQGYDCGPVGNRRHKVTHQFYMDDLKLYAGGERYLNQSLNIVSLYTRDIGMEFGLDKCAVVHLKRGRSEHHGQDMQLIDGSVFHHLLAGETYQYLGLPQRHMQDAQAAKESLREKYRRLLRQIWSSELSGKNKVAATNMLAVPLLLYSFGAVKWTVDERRALDIGTRKMLTLHRSLHPRSSVERLYLPRDLGGRGLLSLERLHDRIILDTACTIANNTDDPLLRLVHHHEIEGKGAFLYNAAERASKNLGLVFEVGRGGPLYAESIANLEPQRLKAQIRTAEVRLLLDTLTGKPLHGQFYGNIERLGLSNKLTYAFLASAGLKSETEGFIVACQDGVINTLAYRRHVMHMTVPDVSCRACKMHAETLMHLLSACPKYAATAYIHRHNAALRVLYYHLRHVYGVDKSPILPYAPGDIESVIENERCRIYWNYSFSTTRPLTATKPDIVLLDFHEKTIFVIEFSAPAETNINVKEDEKRNKYQDLIFDLGRQYPGYRVKLVILIIGVLGGTKLSLLMNLKIIPACQPCADSIAGRMQKAVILGSLRLLRAHSSSIL